LLSHAWIIPAVPALSFLLILGFGKKLPKGGSEIGIAALGIVFVLALAVGAGWIQRVDDSPPKGHEAAAASAHHGRSASATTSSRDVGGAKSEHETKPVLTETTWLQNAGIKFKVGSLVDGLAAMLLIVVTFVSLLVHVYSTDYVAGDRRYTHFFAFLSLFTASMLFFVLTTNTLQLLVGWELVGLCSFALIGHWWEEKPNSDAALKAFLTNRVGDVGLITGVITLFWVSGGKFDIVTINQMANRGEITHLGLLVAACALMGAVMSKSGQFILHTWLPDAMAGPTPVSALIHAATMVVAGIYMIARLYPVFWHGLQIGNSSINLMAVIGAVTIIGGALLAFVQDDIKKVLAYSTISQLGYMVMALGVGAYTGALFHLFTHAFFKACLFLGAGSLSHAVHSFDMKQDMGGMRKTMPKTFATFLVATGALMGIFPLAGFWSKDEILAGSGQFGYQFALVMGAIGAFLTCAYMTRVLYYAFWGEARGAAKLHPPHESGPRIVIPLYLLAGMSVIAGFANFPFHILGDGFNLRFERYVQPTGDYFPTITAVEFSLATAVISLSIAAAAILLSYLWFWKGKGPHGITQRNKLARTGYLTLENKYGLDILYTNIVAGGIKGPIARAAYWFNQHVIDGLVNGAGTGARKAGQFVYDRIDQGVVDTIVNGTGQSAEASGQVLRKEQNGKVQSYGAYLFAGATLLAAVFVFVR